MASLRNRVGQQLGNYRLIRLLGQGGFAEVYLGEHIQLGTQAALKVLYATISKDDIEQFRTEARTIARLAHPHIVRILDFDVEGTVPFLVMSHAPDGTLRKLHPRGSRVPLDTVRTYVSQVATALQYAHQQKIIHRDIKPGNMLLGKHHEVLLSDFGIAIAAQSSRDQSQQNVAGTISYMAPEHIQGQARFASDQYALGIVIYEWLCGTCPFHGSFTELCTQHLFAPPPSLCAQVPMLPPAVEQVVFTALTKDPNERFGSIQAFATAFELACQPHIPSPLVGTVLLATPPSETPLPAQANPMVSPLTVSNQLTIPDSAKKSGISRRTLFLSGIVALVGLGGTGAVWRSLSSASAPTSVFIPTPTPVPRLAPPYIYRPEWGLFYTVAWSPDGKRIASAGSSDGVQVWDAADGGNIYIYRGHSSSSYVNEVAWSPDGKRIASASGLSDEFIGGEHNVQVWDAADGGNAYTYGGHSARVNAVAWSPDGTRIASAGKDATVQVWDAADGGNVYTYPGHAGEVNEVSWSPDSKRIASASIDKTVQVWDAADGGNVYTYGGHSDRVNKVAWSPGGKRIASGGKDETVQVWDAADGGNVYTYPGHTYLGALSAVAWSPNGKRIVSASDSPQSGNLQVWDAADGGNVYTYDNRYYYSTNAAAWSPNGTRIASAGADGTVRVWQPM